MLEAVHTIHEERIVHSDLKPANFLFVKGVLKLIDFGIAKAISDDTTNIHRENQIGTLNYMCPEALIDTSTHRGTTPFGKKSMVMKLGRPSDIWSLGCILYQMIYGRTPFADLGLVQKLQAIVSDDVAIAYPAVPAKYEAAVEVVKLCLQRDPKKRPPIAGRGGLLEHRFLRPESAVEPAKVAKVAKPSARGAPGAGAGAGGGCGKLGAAICAALRVPDAGVSRGDAAANAQAMGRFARSLLKAGRDMERQGLSSKSAMTAVASHLVEQLCNHDGNYVDGDSSDEDDEGGVTVPCDIEAALRHARAQRRAF